MVFAGCDPGRFRQCRKPTFAELIAGETHSGGVDPSRLNRYFIARKLFEEQRYEAFDQARLDELRENKRVFAGELLRESILFLAVQGDSALLLALQFFATAFRTQVLPHLYEWLSPIRIPERRASQCPLFHRSRREFERP